ncbi:MAG: hypothetical protein QM820_00225 [Minicystis sp.]
MRRRTAAIALVILGALPSCGADVPESGPAVTVSVWDEEAGCYARCEGTSPLDPAVAAAAGQACPEQAGGLGRTCALRQGGDRVRIVADYGGVTVTSCADVTLPTLTAILDDETGQKAIGGLSPGCVDHQHYFAQKTLTTPVTSSRTVRFRVASSASYFTDTPSFDLTRPAVGLAVARCLDAEGKPVAGCSLVAGVDQTLVTITVPAGVAESTATLSWTVDGTSLQSQSVALAPSGSATKAGSFQLPAPDAPGKTLTITAQVGDLEPASQSVALVAPDPLKIQIAKVGAALDFTSPPPAVAAGDPTKECRRLTVGILAPKGAPGDTVMLKASQGTLDGSADPVTLKLHEAQPGRTASATLDLPVSPAGPLVQLTASSGNALATSLQLQLLPILPTAAQLAAAKKSIIVDAGGSAAAEVSGFALAPGGASFLEGSRVLVVVKATPSSGPAPLSCGAPSAASDLDCDPTVAGQLPGGCLLAPTSVKLGADGALTIPLAAGVCFAGTVTVDVYAATYASSEACLGDRKVTDGPVRLTTGPALALTYGP